LGLELLDKLNWKLLLTSVSNE